MCHLALHFVDIAWLPHHDDHWRRRETCLSIGRLSTELAVPTLAMLGCVDPPLMWSCLFNQYACNRPNKSARQLSGGPWQESNNYDLLNSFRCRHSMHRHPAVGVGSGWREPQSTHARSASALRQSTAWSCHASQPLGQCGMSASLDLAASLDLLQPLPSQTDFKLPAGRQLQLCQTAKATADYSGWATQPCRQAGQSTQLEVGSAALLHLSLRLLCQRGHKQGFNWRQAASLTGRGSTS